MIQPKYIGVILVIPFSIGILGCGAKSDVPIGDGAESIRKLTLAYVQYAAAHEGIGPKNQEVLIKHLMEQGQLQKPAVDTMFVSPRDKQAYIIRWGARPMGSGPIGPNPPKPPVLVVERTGLDGTRYIVDGQVSVKEIPEAEYTQVIPSDMK